MGLVTGVMGSLLRKLVELLKEEYGLQKGVREKIRSLSREIEVVHAVLRKIGDVPPEQLDELVRLWARDVREASYDMEDIVDAFLVSVDVDAPEPTKPQMVRRLRKNVGKLFKKTKARRKISTLIQDIYEKLDEVAARRGRYTLDSIVVNPEAANTIDPRVLNLYKRAADLVGIEGPRDELIDMLSPGPGGHGDVSSEDNNKMKIVSVVGFGGLGKTTLDKAVYDRLKPCFECGAFVPVGRNPDMKKVLRDILIGLDDKQEPSKLEGLDEKQLMDKLNEFIEKKRWFIVIDDIWDKESWKLIRCALKESTCGSRLVITTRISKVATYAGQAYKIQPLSRDNSKKLLYARIVDDEGKYSNIPSADAYEKVLKKCGGVPLAIITIASLLASKPVEDWSEVYNTIGFGHEDNDDVENTRKILSYSYYDLPSHLKACLLYLNTFLEDQVIEKNSLIWKWIAEGFINEEQAAGVELFELGERYFNELINRSMIQPVEGEFEGYVNGCRVRMIQQVEGEFEGYVNGCRVRMIQPVEGEFEGYVNGCRVHDMVHDLIHSLCSKDNFVTVLNGDEQQKLLPGSCTRRLAMQRVQEYSSDQVSNITVEKVRSFIATGCRFGASFCTRFPVLRVLDIADCYFVEGDGKGTMLDHLGCSLHLRYLRTDINKLPREVKYLKFLQTLDLRTSGVKELPDEVGLLTQLICLRCGHPTRVPAGLIGKLTSLQELWISLPIPLCQAAEKGASTAAAVGRALAPLVDDFITAAAVADAVAALAAALDPNAGAAAAFATAETATMQFVKELGMLSQLRVLWTDIQVTSRSMERALLESLGNLHHIRDLNINGLTQSSERSLLECVHKTDIWDLNFGSITLYEGGTTNAGFLSSRSIRYLCLKSFVFSRLPVQINSSLAPNLSYLDVQVLVVKEQDMETLARLPELCCLKLHSSDTKLLGIKIRHEGYFRKLRILRIFGPSIWFDLQGSECNYSSGSSRVPSNTIMPSLESLEFAVHVRDLKDATQLGFDKLLGLENLGRSSLQRVTTQVKCGGACVLEVEEVEAALVHAATVHPKRPFFQTTWLEENDIISPYEEACMNVRRTPELVNKAWKLANIVSSEDIRALRMPDPGSSSCKIICLVYKNNGRELLALSSNSVEKLWKWERSGNNPRGKAITSVPPQLWKPENGSPMTNDTTNGDPEESACIALSKDDSYSASGGQVTTTFMPPPPAPTVMAFYPQDNNILVVGKEDSSIEIYNLHTNEVETVLMAHQKKITGLVFSQSMKVLVSSGADAQLCVWSMGSWEKMKSRYIEPPSNHCGALVGDTIVQFHYDQERLLVVHESQLAIHDWMLERLWSWFPRGELPAPVSTAVYSCDGLLIYAGFYDGAIGIFAVESLVLQCRITPSAYIPSSISSGGGTVSVYPTVVAVNPWKPNQIAVGMSDGGVHLLESLLDTVGSQIHACLGQRPHGDINDIRRGDLASVAKYGWQAGWRYLLGLR